MTCEECKGTGFYVGLNERETCRACSHTISGTAYVGAKDAADHLGFVVSAEDIERALGCAIENVMKMGGGEIHVGGSHEQWNSYYMCSVCMTKLFDVEAAKTCFNAHDHNDSCGCYVCNESVDNFEAAAESLRQAQRPAHRHLFDRYTGECECGEHIVESMSPRDYETAYLGMSELANAFERNGFIGDINIDQSGDILAVGRFPRPMIDISSMSVSGYEIERDPYFIDRFRARMVVSSFADTVAKGTFKL